ncbi:hypothetical protein Hanom_Chr01g00064101 [Helianthus anomalus]
MYFFWQIKIPCLDLSTSIPRKYFSLPMSFISNSWNRFSFNFVISTLSFPVMIISSTYKIRHVTSFPLCLMNKVWSELLCLNPYPFIASVNLPNQARGDCFRP